jgi:hypothetical protein
MVVNFRTCEINQGTRKLIQTFILIKKIIIYEIYDRNVINLAVHLYKSKRCGPYHHIRSTNHQMILGHLK